MSKKSSRSKKTDGSNVPNFVFKIGGDAPTTPTFGFNSGGSQPGSPLASPGGAFGSNPGSPVASSAFTFNGPSTPTAASANVPFTFGSPNISSPTLFDTKRGVSDLTNLTTSESNTLRRSNSETSFGTPSSNNNIAFGIAPSSPSAGGGFSFNNNTSNNNAPTVSFGTSPAKQPTTLTSAFTFGAPTSSTTTAPTSAASATTASAALAKAAPTLTSSFSFGSTSNDKPATSSFSGVGSGSTEKSTSSNTSTTSASAPFSISGSSSTPSAFTFGKPAITSTTPAATSTTANIIASAAPLASSATAKTAAATTSSPFTFGTPSATASSSTTATSTPSSKATTDKTTLPTFTFGAPSATKTATTSTSSTPSTAFSFGSPTTSSSSTTPTTPATSATIAPSASLFSLGTVGDKDKDKEKEKDKKPAPFTFGSTPSLSTTSTATTTNTTAAATVDPAKPNIYAFDKILDDMAKALAQPPTTMYASLIKPQQQFSTRFRIDNISRSTRFIELPEEAQKELDELEKYIRLEAQRSDYITNQKIPHHLSAMEQAQKDTLQLSQHLDALSNTLKGQMESIEAVYESVKTQLRHASEGCAVLEACKHPGNNARWLFGYSEDDDYFSLLAKQLTNRLEEYKKCIWEIERTTESWKHNRVQSPQEIADIMRTQNQAFLALSNKVAALHAGVQNELNNYHQYLQMYA